MYYARRRLISTFRHIKKTLNTKIELVNNGNINVTKEHHEQAREVLSIIKKSESLSEISYLGTPKITALKEEIIDLAYKFEKAIRIKLYSNRPKKETSDFTKAVSSLSIRAASEKI